MAMIIEVHSYHDLYKQQITGLILSIQQNGFEEISKQSLPKEFPVMEVDVKFYRYILKAI